MEYLTDALKIKSFDKRIPFDVSFELTHRCNQACIICCRPPSDTYELNTDEVKYVLNKLARYQCLFITFTGGEIFMRNDILDLIDFATDLGFALTLKTNGTLLDDSTIEHIKKCRVMEVHISLLGGRQETHDALTGMKGSFDAVKRVALAMRRKDVEVVIMSPITRGVVEEIESIRTTARQWGVEHIIFSAIIFPSMPADRSIDLYRLTDDELVRFYSTLRRLFGSVDETDIRSFNEKTDVRLLSCTAIQNGFTITPDGTVIPCTSVPIKLGNIIDDEMETILFSEKADGIIDKLQLSATPVCASCIDRIGCLRCPGLAFMENSTFGTVPFEACRHTRAFKAALYTAQ